MQNTHKKHSKITSISIATITLAIAAGPAAAEEKSNSINASPLGVLAGSYSLTYERMLSGGHGAIVEGNLSHANKDGSSQTSGGLTVGYRWHWRGQQNSGFLGVNAGYSRGTGSGSITTTTNNMQSTKSFDVDTGVFSLTANIGKRWMLTDNLNITFRIGAGYGNYSVTTDSTDPDAQKVTKAVDDLLHFLPVAFDGELSVGYNF